MGTLFGKPAVRLMQKCRGEAARLCALFRDGRLTIEAKEIVVAPAGETGSGTVAQNDADARHLIHGNDVLVAAALVSGGTRRASLTGAVDLLCVDLGATLTSTRCRTVALPDGELAYPSRPLAWNALRDADIDQRQHCIDALALGIALWHALLREGGVLCLRVPRMLAVPAKALLAAYEPGTSIAVHPMHAPAGEAAHVLLCAKGAAIEDVQTSDAAAGTGDWRSLLAQPAARARRDAGWIVAFDAGDGDAATFAAQSSARFVAAAPDADAALTVRRRLVEQRAVPLTCGTIAVKRFADAADGDCSADALMRSMLPVFGARHGPQHIPSNALGRIEHGGERTLVLSESPNAITGGAALKRAIRLRDAASPPWDRVVVLGWRFSRGMEKSLAALGDPRLDVRRVPQDVLAQVEAGLPCRVFPGSARFPGLCRIDVRPLRRFREGAFERIEATLAGYVLFSPQALALSDTDRARVRSQLAANPLALLETWAIDPDYDGCTFRSVWHALRGDDAPAIAKSASFRVPHKPGTRTIAVRATDVFGNETTVVFTLASCLVRSLGGAWGMTRLPMERGDDFAHELAMRRREPEVGVECLAIARFDVHWPGQPRLRDLAGGRAEAQMLGRHAEHPGQHLQFVLLWNGAPVEPARDGLETHGLAAVLGIELPEQHRWPRFVARFAHRLGQTLGERCPFIFHAGERYRLVDMVGSPFACERVHPLC